MYSDKFVIAVKHDGKILQESGDIVQLPFGSEYSVLLKNLNTARASVKISIDGNSISENSNFIIDVNESIDIERFIKNKNMTEGNKFKFIERNDAVTLHRGIKAEDGLIRVEFQFEEVSYAPIIQSNYLSQYSHQKNYSGDFQGEYTNVVNSQHSPTATPQGVFKSAKSLDRRITQDSHQISASIGNMAGITAPGSKSNQTFKIVSDFPLQSQKFSMILRLVGIQSQKPHIYTRSNVACEICGKASKSGANFCATCGSSLETF